MGTTIVTATANDGNGNTAVCSLTVRVRDVTPPTMNCVATAAVDTLPVGPTCQALVPDYRSLYSATDACSPVTITQSPAWNSVVTPGLMSVTITARDTANNASTCVFIVRVVDQTPPTIVNCPANETLYVPAGQCTAGFTSPVLVGNDNCSGVLVSNTIIAVGQLVAIGQAIAVALDDPIAVIDGMMEELPLGASLPGARR